MIPYTTLREIILEALLQDPKTQVSNLIDHVGRLAEQKKLIRRSAQHGSIVYSSSYGRILAPDDELNINQIVWDLVTERIITPGIDTNNLEWPWLRLTDFGKSVASDSSTKYYDPDGYIARLQILVPNVDEVIVQYLSEALNCFRQQLFFSASVMCGAAAEKAVLLLLTSTAKYESDAKKKKELEGLLERPNLPRIFESIQSKVDQLIEKKELPYTVHQGSSQHLLSLFEMIRVHRNEAVHPNAGKVTREKIFLSIQTIPEALQVLLRLTDWFNKEDL